MPRRHYQPDELLATVFGTSPFIEYCASRSIPFEPEADGVVEADDRLRWQKAISSLPPEAQSVIELELSQVGDLAHRDSIYRLIDVCAGNDLPSDLIPGEAAQALWFLLHRPEVFQEVFFHEETLRVESWHNAAMKPGIDLARHSDRLPAFERALQSFFQKSEGTGRYCAAQSYLVAESNCVVFHGRVCDRRRYLDTFTESGKPLRQPFHPATTVIFAYYPEDGTALLKTRLTAAKKVTALFQSLCFAVLGLTLDATSLNRRFDLDRLKEPFHPPLPEGVSGARVKALELAYSAAEGRRRIRLETNAADGPEAVEELLTRHIGQGSSLSRVRVSYAEIQVKLALRGRTRSHIIRLWPNRSNLNQTKTAEMLRRCLLSWHLSDARRP